MRLNVAERSTLSSMKSIYCWGIMGLYNVRKSVTIMTFYLEKKIRFVYTNGPVLFQFYHSTETICTEDIAPINESKTVSLISKAEN